jgi:predicted nucleic acid-binding protein
MIVVDSCGWLEYFADSDRADLFRPAIEGPTTLIIPSICILEVTKTLLRERGRDIALRCVAGMRIGRRVDLDEQIAVDAATVATQLRMPSADSIILATAQRFGATVWTQDADFEGKPGVKFFRKA